MIPSETQFFLALMLASTMLVVDDIPEWQKKSETHIQGSIHNNIKKLCDFTK